MDQQKNSLQKPETLQVVKQPFFVSQTYLQPIKNQATIEDEDLLQYQNETKPQQTQDQQQKYQPLDSYIISKTLGKGNFGKVKLAKHKLTQQFVAVKILQKDLIFENTDIVRITRQLKIMKKLRHPFVVQLYEIIQTAKQLYLIMEYAQGGDLFEKIVNEERIKQSQAARIYTQIVLGMDYFHSKGVTHRDLKPENILMSKDGTIKIADFGLGNMFKPQEKLKTACGSPCYASPQMLNREPYDPKKIDIWSSGIILYAMVCGYLPFEDQVTAKLYQKIKNSNVKLPSWVSSSCRNLIRGLLTKDPKLRYDVESILAHEMIAPHAIELKQVIKENQVIQNKIEEICEMYDIEEREKLVSDLNKNRHNNLTTLYYLAVKRIEKLEKEGLEWKSMKSKDQILQEQKKQSQQQVFKLDTEKVKQQKILESQIKGQTQDEAKNEMIQGQKESSALNTQAQIEVESKIEEQVANNKPEVMQIEEGIENYENQDKTSKMNDKTENMLPQDDNILSDEQLQVHRIHDEVNYQLKNIEFNQLKETQVNQHKVTQINQNHVNQTKEVQNARQEKQQEKIDRGYLEVNRIDIESTGIDYTIQSAQSPNLSANFNSQQKAQPIITEEQQILPLQQTQLKQTLQKQQQSQNQTFQENTSQITPKPDSIIQQSYQLSMEIQQTLKQLNQLNQISQNINQQCEEKQQQDKFVKQQNIDTFQSNKVNQEISSYEFQKSPQNQSSQTPHQAMEIHQQVNEINEKMQEKVQEPTQKLTEAHFEAVQIQSNDQQPKPIQQQQISSQPQQNFQIENALFSQQDQQKITLSENSIEPTDLETQKLAQAVNYDLQQAQIMQQIKVIESSILKKPQENPIKQNKLYRQNNKKNNLFSTEQIIPQKIKQSTDQSFLQNKNSQQIHKKKDDNTKIEVKNILAARNIRFNERSHSKDTPIVFKSNKNKPLLKPQLEKLQHTKKSQSKSKQKQPKIQKDPKKQVREKFIIAKDKKAEKPQKLKKQQVKNQIVEIFKSDKSLKSVKKQEIGEKMMKNLGITSIKQESETISNKFQNKSRIKSTSWISGIKFKKSIADEGTQQNLPISPISSIKRKDISSTKLNLENQLKGSANNFRQQENLISSRESQKQSAQKKLKSKFNINQSGIKTKSFSQYSNQNFNISNGSSSKIQISKQNQNTPSQDKFNKTIGSFSYHNKQSGRKSQNILQQSFRKNDYQEILDKKFSTTQINMKPIKNLKDQNFIINFSIQEPELINPELILFVSVRELYQLIQTISQSNNMKFSSLIGNLTVFQYPTKDYMYVLNSNLFKTQQFPNDLKKSANLGSPQTRKKTKIGSFEFVELINSIVLTN